MEPEPPGLGRSSGPSVSAAGGQEGKEEPEAPTLLARVSRTPPPPAWWLPEERVQGSMDEQDKEFPGEGPCDR